MPAIIIALATFLALTCVSPTFADDKSCETYNPITGTVSWNGVMCAVDVNGNGYIDDCSELFACSKPNSGGWCNESTNPVGYMCITTGVYYLPNGFTAVGIPTNQVVYVIPGSEQSNCVNYDPDTNTGCQDQTCSPVYTYTCTQNKQTYMTASTCQTNCGGACSCDTGGLYNATTQLCEVASSNPCPTNMPYDPNYGECIAPIFCPPQSTYNASLNECVTNTSFVCPPGFLYNTGTGRCQAPPTCPSNTFFNITSGKCEDVSCPSNYTFNSADWRCERPTDCGSYTLNTTSGLCQTPNGSCSPENPLDTNPDYVKVDEGLSQATGCGPCTTCVSYPSAPVVTTVPPSFVCVGPENDNYANPYNGNCSFEYYTVWGRPYTCSFDGVVTDTNTCTATCTCPAGFTQNSTICTKNPCQTGETLDAKDNVCWVPPATMNGGTCATNYTPANGRCEATPSCSSGTYNPTSGECETQGTATCQSPYTTQGSNCVYPINCPYPGNWNPTTQRCEQPQTFHCDPSYSYDPSSGYCESPIQCTAGHWDYTYWTCTMPGSFKACDPGYGNPDGVGDCSANYNCQSGFTWSPTYYTCVSPVIFNACDSAYTSADTSGDCSASYSCPNPYTWDNNYWTCTAPATLNPCDPGYPNPDGTGNCWGNWLCPTGSTWDPNYQTCVAPQGNCSEFGYTLNVNDGRCESTPSCGSLGGLYSDSDHRCELPGITNCPPGFGWSPPYCQQAPSCPTGGTYSTTDAQCEAPSTTTCPMGSYPCNSGQCTGTANCNQVPNVVIINATFGLAVGITSFGANQGTITFTQNNNNSIVVSISGCTVAGGGNISTAASFSASASNITFLNSSGATVGTIAVTGCTVSGSGAIPYGPSASGGNSINFFTGSVTFTPVVTYYYSCPLNASVACSTGSTPTCTATATCNTTCPTGYAYTNNTCNAPATCPSGGVLNTIRAMCQENYATTITCPPNTTADTTMGVCYYAATCTNGTLDTVNNVCYYTGCPPHYTYCTAGTACNYLPSLGMHWITTTQCYGDQTIESCPPSPSAVKTWNNPGQCYEFTGGACPENFTLCQDGIACNYNSLVGTHWINTTQCYANNTVQTCPPAPTAKTTWETPNQCMEFMGGTCPAHTTLCQSGTLCTYTPALAPQWVWWSQCYGDATLQSCPPAPNAVSMNNTPAICSEYVGGNCPSHFTLCPAGPPCDYNSLVGNHWVYTTQCYGDSTTPFCPAGTSPTLQYNQGVCQESPTMSCQAYWAYQYDSTAGKCYAPPAPCPAPGTINSSLGECTAPPTSVSCPNGFTWSGTGTVCQQAPTCPPATSPSTGQPMTVNFDAVHDKCWTCPDTFVFNPTTGTCQTDPYCPSGTTLNLSLGVCQSIVQLSCPSGLNYDFNTGLCVSPATCPTPQCLLGCWNTTTKTCDSTLPQPCAVLNTYDPASGQCAVNGTPDCPANYTYSSTAQKCQEAPQCLPTDWICPKDTDPVCLANSPYGNKQWEEISPTQIYTYATTVNVMSYSDFMTLITQPLYLATPATVGDRNDIWKYYGTGPFWILNGVLYQDVYLDAIDCTYQDFITAANPPRVWVPQNATATTPCPSPALSWERLENSCVCQTSEVDTYTRTCSGVSFTEALTNTTTTTADMSSCSSATPPLCSAGLQQQGLGQCTNQENFSGSITCSGNAYPQTRTVTTCKQQVPVVIPVETRQPSLLHGVVKWTGVKCTPCTTQAQANNDDVPNGPPPPMDQTGQCTNFEVFSGQDERCRPSGLTTIFSNCCNLSGWFKTWCQQEERELKKRKQADTCVEVGNYCSSDIFGICIQTKQTWCCFNSELSQIINAQGRPQINKGWGTPKNPDCSGFTPQQLSGLDFSSMNFSAYVTSVQSNENLAGAQTNAVQGATNWLNKTTASPQNPPYAPQ